MALSADHVTFTGGSESGFSSVHRNFIFNDLNTYFRILRDRLNTGQRDGSVPDDRLYTKGSVSFFVIIVVIVMTMMITVISILIDSSRHAQYAILSGLLVLIF